MVHWVDQAQAEGWVVEDAETIKAGGLVSGQPMRAGAPLEGELTVPLEFSAKDVVKFMLQRLRDDEEGYRRQVVADRERGRRIVRVATLKYRARKRHR